MSLVMRVLACLLVGLWGVPRLSVAQTLATIVSSPATSAVPECATPGTALQFTTSTSTYTCAATVSGTYSNGTTGADPNLRRVFDIAYSTDGTHINPNFTTDTILNITRTSLGPGWNDRDATAKLTYAALSLTSHDKAQGQHFLQTNTMNVYGMGDAYIADLTSHNFGGMNASGDEGQGGLRISIQQGSGGSLAQTTIASVPAQHACNTTLTQTVTKNKDAQTVTVASSTGCTVGEWVVIDPSSFAGSNPRMEIVRLTAVAAGTISGIFHQSHSSGDLVLPPTKLTLSSTGQMGEWRYLVNMTATPYTTGTVTSISGTGFVGSGTSWSDGMVGGTTLLPGCVSLLADDYTSPPFSVGNPLKGWFGISAVTDATHLFVAHSKESAIVASYKGLGPGAGTYTVRPCARILYLSGNAVWLEPNSFTWTAADTVQSPPSVDLTVTAAIRANLEIYSPNVEITSGFTVQNTGHAAIDAAYFVSQGLKSDNDLPGFLNVFVNTAVTSQATLYLEGKSLTGESMRFQTLDGDNKRIRWLTTQSSAFIGGDYTTGNLVITVGAPSGIVTSDKLIQAPTFRMTTSPALSGTRFVCVDTSGNLTTSTTACSGT